jgi:predicted transposase YdaD
VDYSLIFSQEIEGVFYQEVVNYCADYILLLMMSEITIHRPHDDFFKQSLSNTTVAKNFLQAYLSPAVTQRIQWDSLRLSNKRYTDEKTAQIHSDVVYTCQIDDQAAYIYILLERKDVQKGRQEGRQQEKLDIARNMLSKGFSANLIQELVSISEEEFRQLEKTYYAKDN